MKRENASKIACDRLMMPNDPAFAEAGRQFQGCPSIAITQKGRLFAAWYAGGVREPDMNNYALLQYSDDFGKSWSAPVLIITSSKEKMIHTYEIQLFVAPDGALHVFWAQDDVETDDEVHTFAAGADRAHWHKLCADPEIVAFADGEYLYTDHVHTVWRVICADPDAKTAPLSFSAPALLDRGLLRCKPIVLRDGRWLSCNYVQTSARYDYSISTDGGKTFSHRSGAKKVPTNCDEAMAFERRNGDICLFARTTAGKTAKSISHDGGNTWDEARLTEYNNAVSRLYVSRTPSGRILMISNDDPKERRNMTAYLSEDDGKTFPYRACFDTRDNVSYPDADFYDGKIYVIYDRERSGAREILMITFTEEDVKNGTMPAPVVISKPSCDRVPKGSEASS